jgi:AcrR family transcriptional regulator
MEQGLANFSETQPMPAPTRTPRDTWIEEGLKMLAAGGPDAVRIEPLAAALGVSRGGFYWHFDDRGALLEEMLDSWERESVTQVIERFQEGDDPRESIRRAGATTLSDRLLPIDLAIRDWSRRDAAVAARLRRVDNQRMDFLRARFAEFLDDEDEVEARSLLSFSLLIGNHFLAADHGPRPRAEVIELAAAHLLA